MIYPVDSAIQRLNNPGQEMTLYMVGPWFRVPAEKVFFTSLAICFCLFVTISFFFYLLAGFGLFILLSPYSFGSCCNKHICSYLLFVHMLTAGFFFKGP